MLFKILILLATYGGMEFMAWFSHRYIMHGLGWYFHKDHHQKEPGFFEKNDVYFLLYAIPSWLLIMFGAMNGFDLKFFAGIGIALYGLTYFLLHEVVIHERFTWFRNWRNPFFEALRKAHKKHHSVTEKHGASHFGLLLSPLKK
jgi:beta-carotene 3-hydroxylase